ncbi:MAG TPA: hypothetical protein EYP62_08120 [Kiritimatiellae bacterium]|nr:hypothetical protein [Kiritimatiellia bacterium]
MVLILFVLAAMAALFLDLRTLSRKRVKETFTPVAEIRQVLLGVSGPRYRDPSGRFSIVPPAGWRTITPPRSDVYDVIFRSPHGVELRIMTRTVSYTNFESLVKHVRRTQKKSGVYPMMQPVSFQGTTALRREARLYRSRIMALDFVRDGTEHHILFSAPPDLFSNYLPVIEELLRTYRVETGPRTPPSE